MPGLCYGPTSPEGVVLTHQPPAEVFKLHTTRELTVAHEDTHYHFLRILEANPEATQRELAEAMGVSVGKANYLLRGLMQWRPPRQEPESHRP